MKPEEAILKFEDGSVSSVEEEGEQEQEEIETVTQNKDDESSGTEIRQTQEFNIQRLATDHSQRTAMADHFHSAQDEVISLGSIGTMTAQSEPLAALKMF